MAVLLEDVRWCDGRGRIGSATDGADEQQIDVQAAHEARVDTHIDE
jgi:hypothetical protein